MERRKNKNIPNNSLYEINVEFGTEGLRTRLNELVSNNFDDCDALQIFNVHQTAEYLHADDLRTTEPYINHILRIAIRLIDYYGVRDVNMIRAGLLHDSVEDHLEEMARFSDSDTKSERERALQSIEDAFGSDVASLVNAVTNPDFDGRYDKNSQYLDHVEDLANYGDVRALIIKLADFTDNATGIYYATPEKQKKLAKKYNPVCEVLKEAIKNRADEIDEMLGRHVTEHIYEQVQIAEIRTAEILRSI